MIKIIVNGGLSERMYALFLHNFNTNHERSRGSSEKMTVNIRITETFREELDNAWKRPGYNSQIGFIRHILRHALNHTEINRANPYSVLAGAVEIRDESTPGSEDIEQERPSIPGMCIGWRIDPSYYRSGSADHFALSYYRRKMIKRLISGVGEKLEAPDRCV